MTLKQSLILAYVQNHPGCAILPVAERVCRTRMAGYNAVHRAINRGVIRARRIGNRYQLTAVA